MSQLNATAGIGVDRFTERGELLVAGMGLHGHCKQESCTPPLALQVRSATACMHAAMAEDYRVIVTRLRAEKGMSLEDLAFEARAHAPKGTVSLSLIQKRLAPGSTAQPSPELLAALARSLDVDPAIFPEYRLAKASEELDEKVVGLDQALDHLDRIVTGLRQRVVRQGATATVQRVQRHQEPPATPGEAANQEGA